MSQSLERILTLVRAFHRRHALPRRGERVIAALSGGADSTALVVAAARLAGEMGVELVAVHVDHRLRGAESARDARAAEGLAVSLGVPFDLRTAGDGPARGDSPEAWARDVRRELLLSAAQAHGASRVLLGHTADDQAETVLLRALRGTALTGLGAMRPVSPDGRWLRPLLSARRTALRRALRRARIPWVEDTSNRDGTRPRGRLRHELLPLIEARLGPGATRALGRLADEARAADAHLEKEGRALYEAMAPAVDGEGELRLETAAAADRDGVVLRYALRHAYARVRGTTEGLGRTHLLALTELLEAPGDLHLPGGIVARAARGSLRLRRGAPEAGSEGAPWPETPVHPGARPIPAGGLRLAVQEVAPEALSGRRAEDAREIWLDAGEIVGSLRLRPPRDGDRLRPFGFRGTRKISDLLMEAGVAREARGAFPLLCDEVGILWVVGVRRSDRAPVGPGTRRVLVIEVNKRPPAR